MPRNPHLRAALILTRSHPRVIGLVGSWRSVVREVSWWWEVATGQRAPWWRGSVS